MTALGHVLDLIMCCLQHMMKLQCLALVAAFMLGVSTAACTRLPPSASVLASLPLPAWSTHGATTVRLQFGSVSAPVLLPAPALVLQGSAPVPCHSTTARLGLA